MKLLLDSHALVWFFMGDKRMSRAATRAIESSRNTIFVSAVSGYEIGLKAMRRQIDPGILDRLTEALQMARFQQVPITLAHAAAASELPGNHKDPWDRVLVAQAKAEDLILISADTIFKQYGVRTHW